MARKFRVQYPGAIYHVMNRGDQREAVFRDGEDRQKLLATLGEACRKTEWPVVAPPPFLPRRAICNLENLPGEHTLPSPLKDASWGRQARIWGGLSPGGAEQGSGRRMSYSLRGGASDVGSQILA